jgi:hypothetical protein
MKKRVSICGKKVTIEVPEGYERVFKGPVKNGDLWYNKDLIGLELAHAVEYPTNIEDGWECIFRKIEDLPEPTIDLVIILVVL